MNYRQLIFVASLTLLLLGGCGLKRVDADVALLQMQTAMSQINQVGFVGSLQYAGAPNSSLFNGLQELVANFNGQVDLAQIDQLRYALTLDLAGQSAEGDTQLAAELRGLPDYTYLRLSQAKLPDNLPLAVSADSRWYKIKNDPSATGDILGGSQRLTAGEVAAVRELVNHSQLFVAQTTLPDTTIKGVRTYHLAALIDQSALASFLDQLASVTNRKLQIDRTTALQLATNYTYDLWISQRDYRLVQLLAQSNTAISAGLNTTVLELSLNRFNLPLNIVPPSEVREFSLESLLRSSMGEF